jgi:predicted TIM-barrel fold metal-dependent hydrolase
MGGTNDFDVVDAHVHLYRDLALEKQNVAIPGRRDRDRWAHPEALDAYLDGHGIAAVVALPNFPTRQMRAAQVARLPDDLPPDKAAAAREAIDDGLRARIRRQNAWLCELAASNPRVVPSVGIQGIFNEDEMVEEFRIRAASGARTVKLLPGMYHEYPDDRRFWPLYEACQDLEVAITSDTGTLGHAETGTYFGQPARFRDVLEAFPRLRLVMAHFPSAFWDERLELARRFENVFFDISGGFGAEGLEVRDGRRALAADDAVRVLRRAGVERFMFGSDGPRFPFQPALEQLLGLDLTDAEKAGILASNARTIYRLELPVEATR